MKEGIDDIMTKVEDIKCIVVPSTSIDDWWMIERAEHDGQERIVMDNSLGIKTGRFDRSARLGRGLNNVDIEGTATEMLAIAEAIEQRGTARFKRAAAMTVERGVALSSPRNSSDVVLIPHERAAELAADIRAKVKPVKR